MTQLEQYIQTIFGITSSSELQILLSYFEQKEFKKGEFMLTSERQCKQLSFVEKGYFRMFAYSDSKEITQWIASKGYFLTDLHSFINQTPSKYYIQAITDGDLYSISNVNYNRLHEVLPAWKDLEKNFLVKCFTAMEERIFAHLSMTTEERYAAYFEKNRVLFNQIPLQYIASMLGMTPETLSRVRKKYSKTNS